MMRSYRLDNEAFQTLYCLTAEILQAIYEKCPELDPNFQSIESNTQYRASIPLCIGYTDKKFDWKRLEAILKFIFDNNLPFVIRLYPKDESELKKWQQELAVWKTQNPQSHLHQVDDDHMYVADKDKDNYPEKWNEYEQKYDAFLGGFDDKKKKRYVEKKFTKYIAKFKVKYPEIDPETIRPHLIKESKHLLFDMQEKPEQNASKNPTIKTLLFYDSTYPDPVGEMIAHAEEMGFYRDSIIRVNAEYTKELTNNYAVNNAAATSNIVTETLIQQVLAAASKGIVPIDFAVEFALKTVAKSLPSSPTEENKVAHHSLHDNKYDKLIKNGVIDEEIVVRSNHITNKNQLSPSSSSQPSKRMMSNTTAYLGEQFNSQPKSKKTNHPKYIETVVASNGVDNAPTSLPEQPDIIFTSSSPTLFVNSPQNAQKKNWTARNNFVQSQCLDDAVKNTEENELNRESDQRVSITCPA